MSEPLPAAAKSAATPAPTKKPVFCYEYPQASPCAALVGYTLKGNELSILTTFRAASVGSGRSLTAGGFYEVKDMFTVPDKLQDGDAELYREMHEELSDEIKTLIPYEDFAARSEYLWNGMRRIGTGGSVHAITQKSLRLSEREKDAILAMPDTSEQVGKKMETFLLGAYKDAAEAETAIRERLADFKYPVEVGGVVKLYNKLNNPKPVFEPVGGWG